MVDIYDVRGNKYTVELVEVRTSLPTYQDYEEKNIVLSNLPKRNPDFKGSLETTLDISCDNRIGFGDNDILL